MPINLRGPIRSMSFNNVKRTLGNHLLSNKKLLHFLKNGLYENYRLFKDYLVLVKVILNQVYLLHSLVGLTLSTSFLSFFSPLFGVSASNMQCTPVNSVGYDTGFNGCENAVLHTYICVCV